MGPSISAWKKLGNRFKAEDLKGSSRPQPLFVCYLFVCFVPCRAPRTTYPSGGFFCFVSLLCTVPLGLQEFVICFSVGKKLGNRSEAEDWKGSSRPRPFRIWKCQTRILSKWSSRALNKIKSRTNGRGNFLDVRNSPKGLRGGSPKDLASETGSPGYAYPG